MPDYWRKRADEARAIADDMTDSKSRRIMYNLATQYDELASRAERRLKRDRNGAS